MSSTATYHQRFKVTVLILNTTDYVHIRCVCVDELGGVINRGKEFRCCKEFYNVGLCAQK
jgi:hypothetical protein